MMNNESEKTKILIIDDDANFCHIYKSLLENTNKYSVTTAYSGADGLALARHQKYDVILLDILMPEMGGGAVACLLSCNEYTKDVPCIFITSLIEPDRNSVNDKHRYLGKPVDAEYLISIIDDVIMNDHKKVYCLQAAIKEKQPDLLTMCSSCRQIRNGEGCWERVETHITKHFGIKFSHGICPDCAKKLYPGFYGKYFGNKDD